MSSGVPFSTKAALVKSSYSWLQRGREAHDYGTRAVAIAPVTLGRGAQLVRAAATITCVWHMDANQAQEFDEEG
jgi:hypothetical protein